MIHYWYRVILKSELQKLLLKNKTCCLDHLIHPVSALREMTNQKLQLLYCISLLYFIKYVQ